MRTKIQELLIIKWKIEFVAWIYIPSFILKFEHIRNTEIFSRHNIILLLFV